MGPWCVLQACSFAFEHPPQPEEAGPLSPIDEAAIALVTDLFREHVDSTALVADLAEASARPGRWVRGLPSFPDTEATVEVAARASGS